MYNDSDRTICPAVMSLHWRIYLLFRFFFFFFFFFSVHRRSEYQTNPEMYHLKLDDVEGKRNRPILKSVLTQACREVTVKHVW